ncbi:ribonuclease Y [Candidatus Oleimmundimicrobium sp.]|uniref:ribonuclease Y n=1 Tax=Candidatus Oleimmundimicrobium sp. TaxID=3060597 RepID=UPI002717AA07|nr:ribonuclease Y [Candidatus Oleimmundimicrobium sp.]MDO8885427.1 ribonuclease Y [Candidatus Oleimmundimicrobium sp.]
MPITYILLILIFSILGVVAGFFLRRYLAETRIDSAEAEAKKIILEANKEAETKKKEAILEAKDGIHSMRTEAEREIRERRAEIQRMESRFTQKEEIFEKKREDLNQEEKGLIERKKKIEVLETDLKEVISKQKEMLQEIAKMSVEEAKNMLLKKVEDDARHDAALMVRNIESEAREESEKRARNVVSLAIQRCAADHVAETTVSSIILPGDEMKGRIIGREGRNIRAFENVSGVNLIIDDTPEAVVISCFDSVRREIARIALEKLIADGRIHPARIEEMYKKAKQEVETKIREVGEQSAFDANVQNLHPELIRVLGRLKYRTSYGQNVLMHSIEVCHLAGVMAAELGTDVKLAKRAGLLHDIGKAIDHEVEGSHAVIGADLAKRFQESEAVCHAIEAHHLDVEPKTIEAVLVQSADAISAARPGARRETLESYIKRLENLERIADSHKGVEKSFVMQAGREVRVLVKPEKIDDAESALLAKEIAKEIEAEMEYPGQIKVTVIREQRATEYAK